MKALVTGSAGFVGRHVVAELQRRGWDVTGCDPAGWDRRDALATFRRDENVYSLVVHAAASSPHRAAIDGEPMHFARNLQLDAAMFDWAVRTGQRHVLYLSSSAVYPVRLQSQEYGDRYGPVQLGEDLVNLSPPRVPGYWSPDTVYGWTKLTGEKLAASTRAAGVPVTVVRPFSGYGEDQSDDFPFRALVERARRREDPFTIWGDGTQVRDWIHIDDVVSGALAVVESGTVEPVNLCTGVGVPMVELARMACDRAGYSPRFNLRSDRPAGVAYRVGDPTRLREYYKPLVTLAEGIERALEV